MKLNQIPVSVCLFQYFIFILPYPTSNFEYFEILLSMFFFNFQFPQYGNSLIRFSIEIFRFLLTTIIDDTRNKDSFIFNKKGNPIDCIYICVISFIYL